MAAKDVIKQHMAFTMSETEDDNSDGGHDFDDDDDEDEEDDGNGDIREIKLDVTSNGKWQK